MTIVKVETPSSDLFFGIHRKTKLGLYGGLAPSAVVGLTRAARTESLGSERPSTVDISFYID